MEKFGKEYHREYYQKRRRAILDYLGGKCVQCGATDNLEVDHIDRNDKSFSVSTRMSVKNNNVELDKCQLLCNECHKAKTAKENSGFTHGTRYGYMNKKCECGTCSDAKRVWYDKRNAARRKAA